MKISEKQIQNSILQWLNFQKDLLAWPNQSIGVFDAKRQVYRKPTNKFHLNGVPDILCCVSIQGRGLFVGLEVKITKGIQSDKQKIFEQKLKKVNGFYFIVKSLDDAINAITQVRSFTKN